MATGSVSVYDFEMPRPKSDDPKQAVTLRLPASVVARYAAKGPGWRAEMEALIAGQPVRAPASSAPPTAAPRVRVAVALLERPAFNPQPKKPLKR